MFGFRGTAGRVRDIFLSRDTVSPQTRSRYIHKQAIFCNFTISFGVKMTEVYRNSVVPRPGSNDL